MIIVLLRYTLQHIAICIWKFLRVIECALFVFITIAKIDFLSIYSGMNERRCYMQYASLRCRVRYIFRSYHSFSHAACLFRVSRESKRSREIITVTSRSKLI